ncbi:MAG: SRPBCC domain-containing protein [Acidimicrobiales bacterium]|nr:SRPBCC domain-containing protein [Acidimicrobiales bacterium]
MTDTPAERTDRVIDLSVEVDGTPDEVWRAIATGPGISSWYVPHTVDEREGGATVSSFGPGPEMQIPGVVAAWEPPGRVVFTGVEAGATLAFEWLVEARDGGSCVVRLVNTGFGDGDDWDAQFDGMREGWQLFLLNLQLHLRHFRGESGASMLPMAQWSGGRAAGWAHLLAGLGFGATPAVGDRVSTAGTDAPPLGGTVLQASDWRLALLLDDPAPGTAFLAVEGTGDQVGVSVWSYVYGDERDSIVERDLPRWNDWLATHAPGT